MHIYRLITCWHKRNKHCFLELLHRNRKIKPSFTFYILATSSTVNTHNAPPLRKTELRVYEFLNVKPGSQNSRIKAQVVEGDF